MTPLKVLVNLVSMFFTQNIHNFRGQGVSINHPVKKGDVGGKDGSAAANTGIGRRDVRLSMH